MNKTTLPTNNNQWKSVDSMIHSPEDDRSYLVTYERSDGTYAHPQIAYWIEEEGHFFSLDSFYAQPLYVDLYTEIPELPV